MNLACKKIIVNLVGIAFLSAQNASAVVDTVSIMAIMNASSQAHGDREKQIAVNKALAESEQDFDKQQRFREHVEAINQKYRMPTDGCNQIASVRAMKQKVEARSGNARALAMSNFARNMNTRNQPAVTAEYLRLHEERFCSEEDAKKTGCTLAPVELQNKDLMADGLFAPNESATYSQGEKIAARSYVENIVNPFPTQGLPANLESTPQGKAFIAAQMDEQRMLSLAEHSLNSIYLARQKPGEPVEIEVTAQKQSWLSKLFNYVTSFIGTDKADENAGAQQVQAEVQEKECEAIKAEVEQLRQAEIQKYIPKPANEAFLTGTCLDSIMNTRFNIFTISSLDGLIDGLINTAKNKACSVVMGAWNNVVSTANQKLGTSIDLPYVGNVLNTNVGSGSASGSIVNLNNQAQSTTTDSSGVLNRLQNIFK